MKYSLNVAVVVKIFDAGGARKIKKKIKQKYLSGLNHSKHNSFEEGFFFSGNNFIKRWSTTKKNHNIILPRTQVHRKL